MTIVSSANRPTVMTLGVLALSLSCGGSKSSMDVRDGGVAGHGGGVAGHGGYAMASGGSRGGAGGVGASGGAAGDTGPGRGVAGGGGVAAAAGGAGAVGGGIAGQAGRVATWNADDCHVTAVAKPSDPTASAEWSAARAYCEALSGQGCLTEVLNVAQNCAMDARVEACIQQVLWTHTTQISAPCEDAWNEDIACGAASLFVEPICEGVHLIGYPYGSATMCRTENDALVACLDKNSATVTVRGTYASCTYAADSSSECSISCQFGANYAALTCSGGSGLPKQCGCAINGHVLIDVEDPPTFVNDCADAARQAADGLCTSRIDCCIKYIDSGNDVCGCFNPKRLGYESCQAMAAFAKGTIVDICPQLLPDPGVCWPPNSCSVTTP